MSRAARVLVVTGGFLNEKETSVARALRKQVLQWRASRAAWLDLKIKLVLAEPIVAAQWQRARRPARVPQAVREFFAQADNLDVPELTEVVLATLLRDAGLDFACASVDDVFARPDETVRLARGSDCVFLSTTLLRDLGELEPVLERLARGGVPIVVGGSLASLLADAGGGLPGVDLVAIGYGELLVPALAQWIRARRADPGAAPLPPPGGRVERRGATTFLWGGVPEGRSLDLLPTPDWALAEKTRGARFSMIYYESVRGCPYRCNFCNYPYLFDDTKFRYKSALRIAEDWQRYAGETGAEFVTCLDSLFTMPRPRLTALCAELVRRRVPLKWICYARADDLAQPGIASMMRDAGAVQVQIGIESGDQSQLDNMDKQCSVESNLAAIRNCRTAGLTSVISLIVGFPGETARTLEHTYRFLAQAQPDFYFPATFSTRAYNVPVLNEANRARFQLRTQTHLRTVAPYWRHATMSCEEAGNHVRALNDRVMREGVSLNAALFYPGILRYRPEQRPALLDFQRGLAGDSAALRWLFDRANAFVDRRLRKDVERWQRLAPPAAAAQPVRFQP